MAKYKIIQTVKPAQGWLFCEKIKYEKPKKNVKKAKFEILLPEDVELGMPNLAKIINIGDSTECPFGVDDLIFYKEYSSTEVSLNGQSYLLIPVESIQGKLLDVKVLNDGV